MAEQQRMQVGPEVHDQDYCQDNRLTLRTLRHHAHVLAATSRIHDNLVHQRPVVTLREMYYQMLDVYTRQQELDLAVQDVVGMLGVSRPDLGVIAAAKGLVYGPLRIYDADSGSLIADCSTSPVMISARHTSNTRFECTLPAAGQDGPAAPVRPTAGFVARSASSDPGHPPPTTPTRRVLHPPLPLAPSASRGPLPQLLLIEKEGIFQHLVHSRLLETVPCILITGCGFPTLAVRALAFELHRQLQCPASGLVDCNPYGLAILFKFKFGANPRLCGSQYALPALRWIGLRPEQLEELVHACDAPASHHASKRVHSFSVVHVAAGEGPTVAGLAASSAPGSGSAPRRSASVAQLLHRAPPLSDRDRAVAATLLQTQGCVTEPQFAEALQAMLQMNRKLELQTLFQHHMDYFTETFLPRQLLLSAPGTVHTRRDRVVETEARAYRGAAASSPALSGGSPPSPFSSPCSSTSNSDWSSPIVSATGTPGWTRNALTPRTRRAPPLAEHEEVTGEYGETDVAGLPNGFGAVSSLAVRHSPRAPPWHRATSPSPPLYPPPPPPPLANHRPR